MFNRYWRTYPWGLQVALFLLMIFTLTSFATYLILVLLPKLSGTSIADIAVLGPASSFKTIRGALVAQGASHIGMFAGPALLFASFTHPRLRQYLGIRRPGKPIHWLLTTGIMIGLIPVFLWGESWMVQHLHFGKWADDMQQEGNKTVLAFLKLNTGADLAMLLIVLAVLPAIGEELVFRGILLRLLHSRIWRAAANIKIAGKIVHPDVQRTMVVPVLLTSLLFAAIHRNPYGFLFLFIAASILALIYFLTRSILCSMWAHFLYNGTQVAAVFFAQKSSAAQSIVADETIPIIYPIIGLLIFVASFYLLVKNQTPLPGNWSDDFAGERPAETDQPSIR